MIQEAFFRICRYVPDDMWDSFVWFRCSKISTTMANIKKVYRYRSVSICALESANSPATDGTQHTLNLT